MILRKLVLLFLYLIENCFYFSIYHFCGLLYLSGLCEKITLGSTQQSNYPNAWGQSKTQKWKKLLNCIPHADHTDPTDGKYLFRVSALFTI